jgi:1-acyl-sn-glycerol-3-phosphate acyltransferase
MTDGTPRKRPVANKAVPTNKTEPDIKAAPADKAPGVRTAVRKAAAADKAPGDRAAAQKTAVAKKVAPAKKVTAHRPPEPSADRPAAAGTTSPAGGPRNPFDDVLRRIGDLVGAVIGPDTDEQVAAALAFLRRRLTGDYEVDLFGFDEELTETVIMPIFRPLYRYWFRVQVRGIENIPADGAALVVANHSGTIAIDSVMTQIAVHDEHPAQRNLRMLGADLVFRMPVVADLARKTGTTLACNEDTERLLGTGHVVGVWPEGFKGVGKPFSERYKLQRFGRGGFVSAAVKAGAPIVPCSIVGAEETYPLIGNIAPLARLLGVPYVPVTPTFPWLGPLGLIPLPSKWIIQFGSPIPTDGYGTAAADDPMLVFDLTDRVRETIQHTLYSLLTERGNPFR